MASNTLLLIDLRNSYTETDLPSVLATRYHLAHVKGCNEIETSIASHCPDILCFDYDTPTTDGLEALRSIKCSYPSLPIIMFTAYHSEALAVWALRARVWDYFIKPVTMEELELAFDLLATLSRSPEIPRQKYLPLQRTAPTWIDKTKIDSHCQRKRTQPSIQYIEEHYTRRITLDDAAKSCHMSPSAFSHLFRKEQGTAFSEYLLRYRVARASELLNITTLSVSEIAYAVGFNDASYFSRTYQRFKGVSPSQFRALI